MDDLVKALVLAAADHGVCSCKEITGDEGPRPLGGGRFYHYQGCDYDPDLRAAIDALVSGVPAPVKEDEPTVYHEVPELRGY